MTLEEEGRLAWRQNKRHADFNLQPEWWLCYLPPMQIAEFDLDIDIGTAEPARRKFRFTREPGFHNFEPIARVVCHYGSESWPVTEWEKLL